MRMQACAAVFTTLLSFGGLSVAARAQDQPQPAPAGGMQASQLAPPAGPLTVTFAAQSSEWTPAALAALPHTTVTVYNLHTNADETYSGVPFMDLLVPLGVPREQLGKMVSLYLEAVGSDGYIAVYSVAEVNPTMHNATVIVADSEDGKPLAAAGPFKLIDTRDKLPTRWVRNLAAIRVLTAE